MFSNKRDLQSGNSSRMSDSTLRMQMNSNSYTKRPSTSHNRHRKLRSSGNSYYATNNFGNKSCQMYVPQIRGMFSKAILKNLQAYRKANKQKIYSKATEMNNLINNYDEQLEDKVSSKIKMNLVHSNADIAENRYYSKPNNLSKINNKMQKQNIKTNPSVNSNIKYEQSNVEFESENSEDKNFDDLINNSSINDKISNTNERRSHSNPSDSRKHFDLNTYFNSDHDLNANLKRYLKTKETINDKKLNQNANLLIQDQNEPKNIEEKRKANCINCLNKIFLNPIDYISNELGKDLTSNGAEDIIRRQMIRKVDPECSELFENVSTAPYTIRNTRCSAHLQILQRTKSHKYNDKEGNKDSIDIPIAKTIKRPCTSSCIINQNKEITNAYSYHDSEGKSVFNEQSKSISPLKVREKSAIRQAKNSGSAYQNRPYSNHIDSNRSKPPNVFKDMNISELIKHKNGMLNLFGQNTSKPNDLTPDEYESIFESKPTFYEKRAFIELFQK